MMNDADELNPRLAHNAAWEQQRRERAEAEAAREHKASANGHAGEDIKPEPIDPPDPAIFSIAAWLARDIPAPEHLMGEIFSTTSRAMLVADTGLGKTMFGLGMAFAMADGKSFLHWRGCGRPVRVLYIDGEMSKRLVKERLADAARRAGAVPATLHMLCRDDIEDMPPLNTAAGQRFVDSVIEGLGGVDFIIFDNIQALLLGDMKDEEPWQQTLPWIRDRAMRESW
jgi:hypothetical protein